MKPLELDGDDVRVAVERGVISEAQAVGLRAIAEGRRGLRDGMTADDEPFEFFKGMNEIFIAIGLVVTLVGANVLTAFFALLVCFFCAEYFIRRRRMALPGIVLAASWSVHATMALAVLLPSVSDWPYELKLFSGGIVLAAAAWFYVRYKVPFALVPLGVSALYCVVMGVAVLFPDAAIMMDKHTLQAMFDASYSPVIAFATLAFGMGCFALAMHYDLKDPHRVSRYSACAFWLHMLAAPAMVNMMAYTIYSLDSVAGIVVLALMVVGLTLISLIIDRRSLLLSASTYFGLLLYQASEVIDDAWVSFSTVALVVGLMMLWVGAKWTPLRARIMRGLPAFRFKHRLPPYDEVPV